MRIEQIQAQCPFGPGIHVLIPDDQEVIVSMLESMNLAYDLFKTYRTLLPFVTADQAAGKTMLLEPKNYQFPEELEAVCVLINLLVHPDGGVTNEAIFLLMEKGYQKQGREIAAMMHKEMAEMLKNKKL